MDIKREREEAGDYKLERCEVCGQHKESNEEWWDIYCKACGRYIIFPSWMGVKEKGWWLARVEGKVFELSEKMRGEAEREEEDKLWYRRKEGGELWKSLIGTFESGDPNFAENHDDGGVMGEKGERVRDLIDKRREIRDG